MAPVQPPHVSVEVPTTAEFDTGDLVDPEVRRIMVGDDRLVVAWADSPETRSRGLMEVETLGDLDGMLFDLDQERLPRFTMRNTRIPLDIYFYDTAGESVGMLEMEPCESEPCPTYSIDAAARYALEVPAGRPVDPDGRLDTG